MPLSLVVLLALVQGITEFLPVSSSGHLVLVHGLWGTTTGAEALTLDVAVHLGTLGAVLLYFRADVLAILRGLPGLLRGRWTAGGRLALHLLLATVPVVVAGFLAQDVIATHARTPAVIAWSTIGFGVLLWIADRRGGVEKRLATLSRRDALIIGLAQVLALIPGTSRSGITMTAARFLGYERAEAARFSLLLSIPTILAAGVLAGADLAGSRDPVLGQAALLGAALSFVTALAAIAIMMRWLRHASFTPFVVYRLGLGLFLLGQVYLL